MEAGGGAAIGRGASERQYRAERRNAVYVDRVRFVSVRPSKNIKFAIAAIARTPAREAKTSENCGVE